MDISFIKMDGLGNDFVIMDNRKGVIPMHADFIKRMSDRRHGVGCDQAIILGVSEVADVFMHIYNQDGSVAGACGNATRCVADLLMQALNKTSCAIETISGILPCSMVDGMVEANMGSAKTKWSEIPLSHDMDSSSVDLGLGIGTGFCVNMGNPHIVFLCDDVDKIDLAGLGTKIEHNPVFPERTNVEFISLMPNGAVRMRVWERGGMITKACGSGACAVFIASKHYGIGGDVVEVAMDGGSLFISSDMDNVLMRGPVSLNFKGVFSYEK